MGTTITGTLVDALGQPWANAKVKMVFQPAPGVRGPYVWSGGPFDLEASIDTDAAGRFTFFVSSNNEITPGGSKWQAIIGPNATYPAFVFDLYCTTGTLDISALFKSKIAINSVQSQFVPRAYRDSEVITPPNSGQIYYDAQAKVMKYWENGIWNPFGSGSGGGMVYPPAGIAVSTGSSWAASIDVSALVTFPPPGLANSSGTGWLLSIDPNTLQRNIVLTTNGNSGPATLTGVTLNIPQYAGAAGGMVYPAPGIAVSDGTQWLASINYKANAGGNFTAVNQGVNLAWNLTSGVGETDFINSRGAGAGGFRWYNADPNQALTPSSPTVMSLDGGGKLTLDSILTNTVNVNGIIYVGIGHLRLGDRAANVWNTGSPNINSDNFAVVINGSGNGAVDFNWDQGTGGVQFGNGAGTAVARVNATGDGSFNGAVGAGKGFIAAGYTNGPTAAGSFGFLNDVTYIDSAGAADVRGSIQLRVMGTGAFNLETILTIAGSGQTYIAHGLNVVDNLSVGAGVYINTAGSKFFQVGEAFFNDYVSTTSNRPRVYFRQWAFNTTSAVETMIFQPDGSVYLPQNLAVQGNTSVSSQLNVSGDTIVGNNINANGSIQAGGGAGPKLSSDGGSSFIDAGVNNVLRLNYIRGETAYTSVTGVLDAVTRLNTNSFTIGNTGINGYVLMGNGSSYVPQPMPTLPTQASPSGQLNAQRGFNVVYHNTSGSAMIVSGWGRTNGSGVGSTACYIGPDGNTSLQVHGQTATATVNGGACGFFMCVPNNWYYQVIANNLTNNQGAYVQGTGCWVETVI